MHKTQLLIPNTLHLFFFPPLSSAELSAHAQPPWKTTCVSPLCSLQCQGGEMRTLTENTAAQKCAQLRAGPGDSFTSPTTPEPVSQHNGLEGEYGKLWHTLHVMGNALRCLESRAAERLNWEHNNTETWFQSFLSRLLSHIGFERWSRSWCAPPWLWVSIWTRWTQISATMTGRFFSPTERSSAAASTITLRCSTCHLLLLPPHGYGGGDGSLRLPAYLRVPLPVYPLINHCLFSSSRGVLGTEIWTVKL